MKRAAADRPRVEITSRAEWRSWLSGNHLTSSGIWLVYPRRSVRPDGPTMDDIVEEALAFGWIDSLPRSLDAERSMLLVTPRKIGSNWSALNKRRAERMIAVGLMAPAGLARIEAAKKDGTWNALDGVEANEIPEDLARELQARPGAEEYFERFPRSVKRGILEWILNAKRPQTRAARILETAEAASRGERANQWRGPQAERKPSPSVP